MKRNLPNVSGSLLLAGLAFAAVRSLACTVDAPRPDAPPAEGTANPQVAAPASGGGGVTTAPTTNGCEDLGTLSATSLTAKLGTGTTTSQTTNFALANRPQTTKVAVLALGAPSDLIGKPTVLGADRDVNYATCTHCLLVAIGCTTDCSNAAWFFPRAGSATFTQLASQAGQPFDGTFENVELEQVTIDPATHASTPVAGGACIRIPTLTFVSTTTSTSSSSSSSGSSTSSTGGTSDSGIDSGSTTTGGIRNTSSGNGGSSGCNGCQNGNSPNPSDLFL